MHMTVQQTGVRKSSRKLEGVAHDATHAEPALRDVAELIAARNERAWKRNKPNAPATLASKASSEPLVRRGALKADLTNARRGTLHITDDVLVFGTLRWYAHFSQTGTKHEPRRRPLKFTAPTRKQTVAIVREHILSGLR